MVKVKKNNRNFEVKKYIKKTTPALMSLLVATSCLNGVHYPKNAYASGVTQKINTGDGGVKVLYANNGLNPLNFSIGDAAQYGNKNVEDVVKITVDFPKNHGKNDYGPESKKVNIKYEFNSNKGAYWSGRPFYWFSLPKNVKEPKNIKITNANGHSDSIQNWRQWSTNTRFVASRYQNMKDAINQNNGNPNDWGRFNDQTEEYQKGFNGSFNYQFNRMLDEQDGGWFDENGGTRNFAKSIRNNSKSIYIDWEPRGDGKVTIEVETEVMFPLKSNTLDFAAGAFSVLGNIRIANMQTVTTPHYITYAEKYALDTPEIMEVDNPNNIGEEKKKEIIKKLKEEQKNKDKTKYLVEENNNFGYKQIEVKDNGDTTITFRDLSQQTIAGSRLVTKHVPYKDRFGIKIPQTTEVKKVDSLDSNEINKVKNAIYEANKDNKDFLEGIGNDKNKITVDKTGKAKIEYKDKTSHEIEANKLVTRHIPLAEKYEPLISVTTGVVNKDNLTTEEQKKVKKVLVDINKQANKSIIDALENGEEGIKVDNKGKATLTYKDKSTDTIDPSSLIYQIPKMNERYEPNLIARLGSDNPTDLKEAEKKQLKEALWNANTNLHDKLKGKDKDKSITIEKDGKATFTYEDDTKDVIPGEYLVYKKGEKASPVTRLVQNGDKKYYLTPIVVADMNKLNGNNFADALRRFLFDNYTWNGKEENFEKEVKKTFLTVTGGYLASNNNGWLETQLRRDANTYNIKAKNGTQNIEIPNKIIRIGYDSTDKSLDFRHLRGFFEDQYFKIEKEKLFITNGGAFDVDKAKKEADDIIDKLKNEKGLSNEEADKLKKEIEDAKGNGTLNQDKINEIIKKANEQAKKDSEAEKLKKAKDEAEKELKKLTDIKNEDKKGAENNIKQADTIDKVQKALDEAKKKDQEEKAKKEAEALLKKQKEEAKKVINSLNNLEKGEKEPYTKSNGSIDQAKDEKAIQDLVEKAKAQDKANADKKALDEAKKKAKEIINKLQNLSNEEKKQFTEDNKGSVDKANTKEDVDKQIKEAQKKDADNKKALDQAKNKAKEEIGKLKHLSPKEKEDFGKEIDKAKNDTEIQKQVEEAKKKDLENAKKEATKEIEDSKELTQEEQNEAKNKIKGADSSDKVDKIVEDYAKKESERKAKKEKEEADKLKEEYKQKIENTQGLDQKEKQDYKKQIDEASSKGQMDSIVEMAQAKAKQKQAKEEIDKLSHLNKKQKESLKDNIDNLISDTDINNEVSKANDLDSKMDTLQKLVAKTDEADIKDRLNNAKQEDKTNYQKALAEAKKVSEKETGVDADSSTVEQLTKDLEEAINKLNPNKPKVKIDINKEALNKEIKKAKELKEKDIYKNSETKQKTDFESKLNEAEKIANDNNATQDKVEKALADLINAENNLNGKFKLETKDSTPALIGVSDNDGTKVEKETDKKSILDKIKDIPKDAVTSISPVKTDKGKKVVTVTVVKDNVSQTIDIPIKSDTTKPTVQVTNENQDIYKTEEFKEMKITATDENLDTTKDYITVEGLDNNSWLTYDKATKTIKLKTGTTVPKTATTTKVTIKVVDKVGNKGIKDINITVKSQSDKYTPKAKSDTPTRKVVGEKVNSPKDYVENTDKNTQFPANTTFKWKENNTEKDEITLNKVGKDQEKEIEITYPDGSHETVKVKFNVVADINLEKQDDEPVYLYETLVNNHDIQFANQDKVKAKVKGIPDGATITYSKVTSKQGKNYVTVTVEKDGVKKSLDIEVVGDTTSPTITVEGTTPIRPEICEVQVTRMENFPELTVKAEDDNLDESTLSVTPDVDWLEFDKTTKKIKLKTGNTSVPKTAAAYVRVRISVADKTGNTSYKTLSVTVKSQADKYKPVAKDTVNNKNRGDKAGEAKNYVKLEGNNQFPANTTFKWKENNQTKDDIDLDTPGDSIEKTIEIIYPDGSGSSVKVKFNVAKTNLTEPTISEKDNGDIEIQAGPNATSLELTYTDKADKEKTVTLTKTGGAWTNLPAGFTANGDKITLSHESTKEGSTVKAKSKADNYNDSNEKTLTRTKTSPKNPATEVFVKGQVAEGQALSAEDKALVIASLKDENKNGGTPNIEDSAKIRTENGKQVIDVTITHKDGSKSKISVPLKQDGTKPEITITYDTNNKLTKLDKTLPEIKIEASDANSGINGDVEVTGLPDYLTYDKTTKTIKFANGKTEIPKTAQDFTIKVKVKDKVGNEETKEQKITVQNQSDKYSPETLTSDGTSTVRKYKGQEVSKPETYVKDKEKLPNGTTYKWKNETGNPKLDTLGEVEKEIEITYPDDSKETVKVKFKVVEEIKLTKKDENPVLVNEKVEVGKELQQEVNKEKIKAKIDGILADSTVKFGAVKEESGKKVVPVTVEKDGERKEISIEVKEDTTKPVVSIKNSDKDIITGETLPELKVEVTDENVDDDKVEVTVPSWLNYDKQTKTIKLKAGDKVPNTIADNEKKITVKATDKAGNVKTKEITLTIKSQSEKYSPEAKLNGSVKKVVGEATDKAENYIKDKDKLPTGTTFKWKENKGDTLTLDTVGKDQEKEVVVTFPDGSEKEVKVKFNVVDTKPSAPTVAVLKNGDVTITPSDDSDKVVVGYTPKDSDKEKFVEATKDQGKWNLPEGFKEENGKIIIPDEITQNNTAVKVKASKGTSDYTTEETKQLSKKELLPPLKVTISGSDAKDTVLTEENKTLITGSLTDAQTGGGVASIEKDAKIKEDIDGSKYVEVTLTYDDQSTKVIKVPVVGDSTGPVFEGLGDASVKKYETFKPIEIKATDAGSALRDNEPYEVENLPSWLEFDKATNKVKLANALTRVPKEATTVKFKVKAYDKFNNVTEQEVTVTVNEAEEFTFEKPVIIKGKDKDKEKLSPEDEKTILDAVRGTNKLDGAEPSIVDKTIKVSGDESSVDVTLTYDDNQTRVINVKVEQDAKLKFGLHLPSEKVEVNDINNLNQVEQAKVLEKVKLANSDLKEKDGYTYTIVAVTGQDKKAGTVTVAKDGKVVGELPGERLVKERDITKYDVVLPKVKVQVENKTNLKADEKEKVKEALENATDTKGVSNKDKFPKGTKLEVQGDGTVIISYPDKTTKTILGSDLVDGPSPYVKTIAEEVTPKVPAEKVKVANPSSLDDKEIAKVKEKILEANKDTFPANTTVEVAKDGTATITYKDGSSDTIKNTDLVEKAKEKLTDAKQNPAVKPNAKVEVEDSKKLTDDEKAKVKENVKNTNPKAKDIVVGADGTVEITYPDGSENTIKPEDTVVQKAGKTPKESEAVQNPAKVPAVKVQVADTTKLTAEEIAKVKEEVTKVNPNATKVEVSSNGTATLTYKDGSENIVAGEKLVEQKAKGKTLAETVEILVPDVKTEVINPNRLSTAEKEKVKENLKAKNAGKLDSANITVQNNGTVTVEFADGSAKTIDGEKLVTKKADDGKLKPTIADLTDVDAPIYTKVAEYGKLTEIEKEAVKKAVIEANGGEDGKLKDADIKVLGDGTVVITYKDKSTDIIPADKTVNVGQSGSEALVQPALPEYPLDKLKPVADDFITEETQKIKDEINDSNIYSKEEKQKALAKIDEMVKKAKQKVQNAENDDKVLNTINEVLQDAKEFSKNIKENKLAEIAKAKAEAKAEIDKLANLTDEQKTSFKAEVDKAENLSDVKEVLDKAKVKDKEELAKAKAAGKAEIDKLVNLTDEQKSSFKKEADKAKTKADVKEVLDKAKAKDKEELDKAKAEAKSQIDKLANLTDEQKSSFKKDIQAGKDKNTVAKILDKAKEANKKVKGKAGAKEKAKGQSTLAKTGLNTTNTVGLGAIISLIALALRRKFKK